MSYQYLTKYILEGLAVAVAAKYIPNPKLQLREIVMIALAAAVVFLLLDLLAPDVGKGARLGAGFGIGAQQVGWETMESANDDVEMDAETVAKVYPGEARPDRLMQNYLGEHDPYPPSIHCRGTSCYPRTSYWMREAGYPGEYLGEHDPIPWSLDCRGSVCYKKGEM